MTHFLKTALFASAASLILTACNTAVQTEAANEGQVSESQVSENQASAQTEQEPVWDANKVILESQKLADGVFAIIPQGAQKMAKNGYPIATTSGFVIGNDGVAVIDSMLNKRLADQVMALVKAETRKPIKYVINTSAHGDHSYGNYAFPADVEIIQHQNAKTYVDNYIDQDKAFMIQNFGKGRGIEEAIPRTGDRLIGSMEEVMIDLGGKKLVIRDFGFAQTGGDLFVWEPEAKVLWTGNAVVAEPPALPWLLDGHLIETRNTLQAVYNAMPNDAVIVPGHGPITTRDTIKWNVDYLSSVESQVRKAVKNGLTLEETNAAVSVPDYTGYALYDWVHSGLNVPAAYKDIKGD